MKTRLGGFGIVHFKIVDFENKIVFLCVRKILSSAHSLLTYLILNDNIVRYQNPKK